MSLPARLDAALRPFAGSRAFAGALALGVALRLALVWLLRDAPFSPDPRAYHDMALALVRGESFEPYYPPGPSLLLAPFVAVFGDAPLVARAATIVFFVAAAFALRAFTRALARERAANLAVLVLALYPTAIRQSVDPVSHMPGAACLLAIAFLAPALIERARAGRALLLGLATAGLVLVRPSALPFLVAVPLYLIVRGAGSKAAAIALLVALLPVGAWLAHARAMSGRFVPINSANAVNFFFGNNPYTPLYKTWWFGSHNAGEEGVPAEYSRLAERLRAESPVERERLYRERALEHIRARPDLFVLRTANRVRAFFAFDSATAGWLRRYAIGPAPFALGVMALEAAFWLAIVAAAIPTAPAPPRARRARELLAVAAGASLLYAAPYFAAFSHPTYHVQVAIVGIGVAAALAERVATEPDGGPLAALRASRARRRSVWLALGALALIQLEWVLLNLDRWGR
jgi:4-amino-4-deoxy-L-arabinose transferase-like glycosyltransferase